MRTTRFKSDKSIISIGTVSQNLGTIDDLDDILQKHQDKDLYFRIGINPTLAWTEKFHDNKIGNEDIYEINRIYVDLDLRKEFEKKNG